MPVCYLMNGQRCFGFLMDEMNFLPGRLCDQIALYAVYMPIIREDFRSYKQVWNTHRILKQPNRPTLVYGQPIVNYNWPAKGVQNHQDSHQPGGFGGLAKCCT